MNLFINNNEASERALLFLCLVFVLNCSISIFIYTYCNIASALFWKRFLWWLFFNCHPTWQSNREFQTEAACRSHTQKKTVASLSVCAVRVSICDAWEHNSHRFDIYIYCIMLCCGLSNGALFSVEGKLDFDSRLAVAGMVRESPVLTQCSATGDVAQHFYGRWWPLSNVILFDLAYEMNKTANLKIDWKQKFRGFFGCCCLSLFHCGP